MTTMRKLAAALASLGLPFLVLTCGTATLGTGAEGIPASKTTLMGGWENKFSVEWSVAPEPGGMRRLQGYVVSRYGQHAEPFRVLGRALDQSGAVVGQRIAWIPGGVAGFGRVYFNVPHLPAADHYVVTVWDYTIIEAESIMR